jgi:microcompartment protein CcmL/EutN
VKKNDKSSEIFLPSQNTEALGMLEISSLARGYTVLDAMVKKAQSCIVRARPVSPGKFLIIIDGSVAEVEESLLAGEETASDKIMDRLFLPQAHEQIKPAITGIYNFSVIEAVGLFETHTSCSTILAADAALKAAEVSLFTLHLSVGIGGKAYFGITGILHSVEASILASQNTIRHEYTAGIEIIPRPHMDFVSHLKSIPQIIL